MAYRKIDPRLWDDERFVELSCVEKLLWLYLLTGPHTTSLPGLWIVGVGELVDGLRLPAKSIQAGLEKLERMGRLVSNPRLRLVRIPNAPRYNRPDNARVLKAWFKLWTDIPDCQQKYDHLDSLRAAVFSPRADDETVDPEGQPEAKAARLIEQWKATFGAVVVPERYQRPDRKPARTRIEPSPTDSETEPGYVRADAPNGSRTSSEPSPNSSPAIYTATASGDLDPGSQEKSPETARAHTGAQDVPPPSPKPLGVEAAALLAKLRAHECLSPIATEATASGLATQVTFGRATLAEAERAVDEVGFAYAVEREHAPKTRADLSGWVSNRIGWEARERSSRRDRGSKKGAPRGPSPQPGPAWIDPAKKNPNPASPEEQETPLV
jgi:hypothetical protein